MRSLYRARSTKCREQGESRQGRVEPETGVVTQAGMEPDGGAVVPRRLLIEVEESELEGVSEPYMPQLEGCS